MSNALLKLPVSATFAAPTADATYVVARAPKNGSALTVVGGSVCFSSGIASSGTNYMSVKLQKVGVDGAATPVDITDNIGGTGVAWTANRPKELTPASATLQPGEYVVAVFDATGTVTPGLATVTLSLAAGVAA